jgi:hypothetical protein
VLAAGWFVYVVEVAGWSDQLSIAGDSFCHLISPFAVVDETAVVEALAL